VPRWALLALLSLFALGLGTTFPISVVSIQNSVHRSQVGTVTGALNFFRALAASFTVVAFRYVFAAAAALMAGATLLMLLMEERPLAGPASVPAEMAE
jgi:hypothetical protein